ncbi:MAG: hypothetical protein OEV42_20930 [Deltaproteobacteria bacterium]|nr:hypothetical protein [Deltaproteobacteria bacterium]
MSIKILPIIVILNLLVSACMTASKGEHLSEEDKKIFQLDSDKRHEEFKKLSVEKQLDIYLYALTKRHPPDFEFAYDIAVRGREVVPFLTSKFIDEKDEGKQQLILFIFELMKTHCNIQLQEDEDLILVLKEKVSLMKNSFYKKLSKESIKAIAR